MNSGDTAWILTSTIFVLFMTLPGIAMFYGGLMHSRSVLSVMMQCFSITSISTLLWLYIGYPLAFGESVGGVIGSIENVFFIGLADGGSQNGVPDIAWALFHMTFAILTPALIVGSYTERIKFPAVLVFSALWSTLVYAPICHWVWGGGWLSQIGIMDSAGGVTLHVSVGVAGLIAAIVIGKRLDFPSNLPEPHNPGLAATGVGMLWIGWLALNGGMQVFAGREPSISVAVTHIAAAAAVITWMTVQWIMERRPTLVGTATGAIAGLAIATPASAFVSPLSGLVLGAIAGIVCYFAVGVVKNRFNIDDSMDVFAVHGVGGILGVLLTAILAHAALGGSGYIEESRQLLTQLGIQALAIVAVATWTGIVTFILLKLTGALVKGARVDEMDEIVGLDIATQGERGYDI